jgi:hypothetical protein
MVREQRISVGRWYILWEYLHQFPLIVVIFQNETIRAEGQELRRRIQIFSPRRSWLGCQSLRRRSDSAAEAEANRKDQEAEIQRLAAEQERQARVAEAEGDN